MPPDDLRARLLDGAEAELAEHGVGALSLRAIARRAGVSHQAPGYHFADRAGLLTALAVRTHEALAQALADARDAAGDDGPARLRATGHAYVRFARERPALFAVLGRPELWRAEDPDLALAGATSWGVLAGCVAEATSSGWGRGLPEDALALTCWTAVHGVASLARDGVLGGERHPGGGPQDDDAAASAVVGVLVDGLR